MDKCYTVQNHGTNRQGHSVTIGPKYRMNEFEASVLLAQLPHVFESGEENNDNWNYNPAILGDWLKSLPKPIALFA